MRIAFIGLGVMGYPMAGHLAAAGHEMRVFNRSPEKTRTWVAEFGGEAAESVATAVSDRQAVALCVGNDHDLLQCLHQILPSLPEGGLIIDHTTISARPRSRACTAASRASLAEMVVWSMIRPPSGRLGRI